MVYIDYIREYPEPVISRPGIMCGWLPVKHRQKGFTRYCRMWADTPEELAAMAEQLNLTYTGKLFREQPFPHWILRHWHRWEALRAGVQVVACHPSEVKK